MILLGHPRLETNRLKQLINVFAEESFTTSSDKARVYAQVNNTIQALKVLFFASIQMVTRSDGISVQFV